MRLAEIEGQLGMVTTRVGDVLSVRLTDIEKAQERLMHVVEGINAEQDGSQDEERDDEEIISPRPNELEDTGRPFSIGEGSTGQASVHGVPDSVTSQRMSRETKEELGEGEGTKGEQNVKGTTTARVRTEVPTYTENLGPPLTTYMTRTGGAGATTVQGATSAPPAAAAEIKVDPPARYSGARVPGVRIWLRQVE